MQTENIIVDWAEARALYRKYREHQHYQQPIDWEIQRIYQLIAQGRLVIRALASIAEAGVDEQNLPKLAICRAGAPICFYKWQPDYARFAITDRHVPEHHHRHYIDFPAGTFPQPLTDYDYWRAYQAMVPLVPIHLRPKRGLANYHILWEAEWQPVPPRDLMLPRRTGEADLWVVVAAWDLTEVERAALAAWIPVR